MHENLQKPSPVEGYINWKERGGQPMSQTLPEGVITDIKNLLLQASITCKDWPIMERINGRLQYVAENANIHRRDVEEAHWELFRDGITTFGGHFKYEYSKPTSSASERSPQLQ